MKTPIDQIADELCRALREKHSDLCIDEPNVAEHIAAAYVLELLSDARKLSDRIKAGCIK